MTALRRISDTELEFSCPACKTLHRIRATESGDFDYADGYWRWNTQRPASPLTPSDSLCAGKVASTPIAR
jgi:hypothetical protein